MSTQKKDKSSTVLGWDSAIADVEAMIAVEANEDRKYYLKIAADWFRRMKDEQEPFPGQGLFFQTRLKSKSLKRGNR